jgi:ATP-dependent DNA ligase
VLRRRKKSAVTATHPAWEPMEARQISALPAGPGWQYEPKWDGFRCIGAKSADAVALTSRSGKPLTRYFPEVEKALAATRLRQFVLDGELCIREGNSLSFESLQMRLHPAASRIAKLSQSTPAIFVLFDLLSVDGRDLRSASLSDRRAQLEDLFPKLTPGGVFRLSTRTTSLARASSWLQQAGSGGIDGVVAKRLDESYQGGVRAMMKVKRIRSADCVIGGFRYGAHQREVASLLLGLYDRTGKLNHVGFTSGISAAMRPALTKKLEKIRGGEGFSGSAPGGPSRWSSRRSADWVAVRNRLVVEVQYDQVCGDHFRHGTSFLRWRPDKDPRQCTMDQLDAPRADLPRLTMSEA